MTPIDALTNVFTAAGFEALVTDALGLAAVESEVTDGGSVVGQAEPRDMPLALNEPGPVNDPPKGDALDLRNFTQAPVRNPGGVASSEPVQGFLGNCPLVAVLVAMAHVPAFNRALAGEGILSRAPGEYATWRDREVWEFDERPVALPRLPSADTNFEGDRVFTVRFYDGARSSVRGKRAQYDVRSDGFRVSELVTPVLWIRVPNGTKHFARTNGAALWVSLIEKAFIRRHDAAAQNAYQALEGGVTPLGAMFNMCGWARQGQVTNAEVIVEPDPVSGSTEISDPLTVSELRAMLRLHRTRPTILGSLDEPADTAVIGNHTYAVTGFDREGMVQLVNALDSAEEPGRVVSIPFATLAENFGEVVQGPNRLGVEPT